MLKDPVVEEVRNTREALAAEFDYDLHRISVFLTEQEHKSSGEFVTKDMIERKNTAENDSLQHFI